MKILTRIYNMTIKYSEFKPFETSVMNITDDFDFIKAHYLAARTDVIRQQIIDGIKDGLIKTKDDIREITKKLSPAYN